MSAIFISHSSRDDAEAAAVRGRLREVLADPPYGHEVLLDEIGIQAGELWRPKLYRWLAECTGAVLLLTEQAVLSDWVRKEATILLWRHALGSGVLVIPVLIGVNRADVEAAFPALELFERQYLKPPVPVDVETLVSSIAERMGHAPPAGDKLGGWVGQLESEISGLDRYYRSQLNDTLRASEANWSDTPDGVRMIAHALLYTEQMFDVQTAVEPILAQVRDPKGFVKLVAPIGVPPETSAGILTAFDQPPGDRVLVLAGSGMLTAQRYVQRATCVARFYSTVDLPRAVDSGGTDTLFAAIFDELADGVLHCPPELTGALRRKQFVDGAMLREDRRGRIIQLLRAKTTADDDGLPRRLLKSLVARLRREVPLLVILVLVGPPYPDDPDLGIPGAHVVRPAITDALYEATDNSYLARLTAFAAT